MATPSISVRRHIRWPPDDATEPTSTLVLTSGTRRFIDIRITKPGPGEPKLPNGEGPDERLEWAFAGVNTVTPNQPLGTHSEWTHEIDSRTDDPARDHGYLVTQADGSTLEEGSMVNPATGVMTQYEEVWDDLEALPTGSDSKRVCIVMQIMDNADGAKGIIVRVGRWCQAIMKVQGRFMSVERWEWVPKSNLEDSGTNGGDWTRVAKFGALFIPCSFTFNSADDQVVTPGVGSEVNYGNHTWKVIEKYVW